MVNKTLLILLTSLSFQTTHAGLGIKDSRLVKTKVKIVKDSYIVASNGAKSVRLTEAQIHPSVYKVGQKLMISESFFKKYGSK